jgi:hypothetical protein
LKAIVVPWGATAGLGENDWFPRLPTMEIVVAAPPPPPPGVGVGLTGIEVELEPPQLQALTANTVAAIRIVVRIGSLPSGGVSQCRHQVPLQPQGRVFSAPNS